MTGYLTRVPRPLMQHIPHEAKEPRPTMTMAEYAKAENRAMNQRAPAPSAPRHFSQEAQAEVFAFIERNPLCQTKGVCAGVELSRSTVQGCLIELWRAGRIVRSRQHGVSGFLYTATGEATGERIKCGCSTHDHCGRHGCRKEQA